MTRLPYPEIISLPISKLSFLDSNPRKIDKNQFEKLIKSIRDDPEFLMHRPILINMCDEKYWIYAGSQRVRAAKKIGMKEIPCMIDIELPDTIMQRRMIQDNLHYGEWDWDILADDFDPADLLNLGFTESQLQIDIEALTNEMCAIDSEMDSQKCPTCGKKLKKKNE